MLNIKKSLFSFALLSLIATPYANGGGRKRSYAHRSSAPKKINPTDISRNNLSRTPNSSAYESDAEQLCRPCCGAIGVYLTIAHAFGANQSIQEVTACGNYTLAQEGKRTPNITYDPQLHTLRCFPGAIPQTRITHNTGFLGLSGSTTEPCDDNHFTMSIFSLPPFGLYAAPHSISTTQYCYLLPREPRSIRAPESLPTQQCDADAVRTTGPTIELMQKNALEVPHITRPKKK